MGIAISAADKNRIKGNHPLLICYDPVQKRFHKKFSLLPHQILVASVTKTPSAPFLALNIHTESFNQISPTKIESLVREFMNGVINGSQGNQRV